MKAQSSSRSRHTLIPNPIRTENQPEAWGSGLAEGGGTHPAAEDNTRTHTHTHKSDVIKGTDD